MSLNISNNQINEGVQKFFLLTHHKPLVTFDLVYPYTYLFITDSIVSDKSTHKAKILLDYFLRITLKKTNGERKSFSVNFISYLDTMRVIDHSDNIAFTLNLLVAGENKPSRIINSQDPYYYYAEVSLEPNISAYSSKPIELKIYYQDCDGLELNKL